MAVFSSLFTQPVLMLWNAPGVFEEGVYKAGTQSSKQIVASVQRLSMAERQLLPEGFRSSTSYKLYTEEPMIQTLVNESKIDAAFFQYRGDNYKMLAWEKWDYLVPHWKITVVGVRG